MIIAIPLAFSIGGGPAAAVSGPLLPLFRHVGPRTAGGGGRPADVFLGQAEQHGWCPRLPLGECEMLGDEFEGKCT